MSKNIGMHYGLGVGYTYKNLIFEFLYLSDNAIHKDKVKYIEGVKIYNYINYQTFNFNVGYRFDFNFPEIERKQEIKQPKVKEEKKVKKSEKELLIEQNELLKKQIELLQHNKSEVQ